MPRLTFKVEQLPNTSWINSPENMEYMRRKQEEADAKEAKATKKAEKPGGASSAKRKSSGDGEETPAAKKAKVSPATAAGQKIESKFGDVPTHAPIQEILSVYLEGEDDESVELYDTCDAIRKKIDIHLTMTGQTKASFLRDIARAGWPHDPPKLQTRQLTVFQEKDGPRQGCLSRIYYGAYCYFEKKRIAEDKPKDVHRQLMEQVWPNGMERKRDDELFFTPAGMRFYVDEFGKDVLLPCDDSSGDEDD